MGLAYYVRKKINHLREGYYIWRFMTRPNFLAILSKFEEVGSIKAERVSNYIEVPNVWCDKVGDFKCSIAVTLRYLYVAFSRDGKVRFLRTKLDPELEKYIDEVYYTHLKEWDLSTEDYYAITDKIAARIDPKLHSLAFNMGVTQA